MISTAITNTKVYQQLGHYIPARLRRNVATSLSTIEQRRSSRRFGSTLDRWMSSPELESIDDSLLNQMIKSWDNLSFSAQLEYARACVTNASTTTGPILECGSGLSTILMGIIAEKRGIDLWSLEHHQEWAQKMKMLLRERNIKSVHFCTCDLIDLGGYQWYNVPICALPINFALVVCDGPPSTSTGGRYGLLPAMKHNLVQGALILLDDMNRQGEQEVVRRWQREASCSVEIQGDMRPFAAITYWGST